MYKPQIQKLFNYCFYRIDSDLEQINLERKAEEKGMIFLSEETRHMMAQRLLNIITDTEWMQEEVDKIILENDY